MTPSAPSPITLDELIALVHDAHPDGDPLAQLSEAVLVSQQLTEQADHLIGHFVDQARRSGASWTTIGESMGVTKQAAQKRFVPGALDEPRAADATLFTRFTVRAREAVSAAQDEAGRLGSAQIGTEHLLLGLMTEPDGLAAQALVAQGVDARQVREAVGPPAEGAAPPSGGGRTPFASRSKKALQLAVREALRMQHNYIGTEHLLLALFSDHEGEANVVFERLGVREDRTRAWIAAKIAELTARRNDAAS